MHYIPCNSALLAQETMFLTQKGICPKISKKCVNRDNLNSRQNSVCLGLKFSSESKLFGGGPPCPRTTSVTLITIITILTILQSLLIITASITHITILTIPTIITILTITSPSWLSGLSLTINGNSCGRASTPLTIFGNSKPFECSIILIINCCLELKIYCSTLVHRLTENV